MPVSGVPNEVIEEWVGVPPADAFRNGAPQTVRPALIVDRTTGILYAKRSDGVVVAIGADAQPPSTSGSWTPSFTGSGGGSGQTYNVQVGTYVRIGRIVVAKFDLSLTAIGVITGDVQVQGLPFPPAGNDVSDIDYWAVFTTALIKLTAVLSAAVSKFTIYKMTVAATSVTPATLVAADMSASARITGTVIYETAAAMADPAAEDEPVEEP